MKTRLICPACNSTEVKEIAYGFPDVENFDFDRFEIWLFSDDPQRALDMLPSEVKRKCNTFTKSGISANEEWQLMRYASEFYISNSTYSWWAARLAFNSSAKVFVPKPWFAAGSQPNKLIPPEWVEVGRFK